MVCPMCGDSEFRLCDEMFGHFLGSQTEVNWETDFLKKDELNWQRKVERGLRIEFVAISWSW
jgi:hypothetical protein